jgi:soluble lytic murein transglycosylase-like protein
MPNRFITIAGAVLLALASGGAYAGTPAMMPREPAEAAYYANVYADHYGVPRALVHAIIRAESNWHPNAVSDKGAMGLMQLMPATARAYGVRDPFSVTDNLNGGVRYLASLIKKFGDLRLVVAAYYRGSHPIEQRGLNYSNRAVSNYVRMVRRFYDEDLQRHQDNPLHP